MDSKENLYSALAKAQGSIKSPTKNKHVNYKDKNNRTIDYSYADLTACYEACIPELSKNGLAITHIFTTINNVFGLATLLTHESGQTLETFYPMRNPTSVPPQAFGSDITYAKRYSLCSIVGFAADEDDDGAIAQDSYSKTPPKTQSKPAPKPIPNLAPKTSGGYLGDYQPQFGKFKLQKLSSIDPDQLWQYIDYIEGKARADQKEITGQVKEFIDAATEYLKGLYQPAAASTDSFNDPNYDPSFEEL